MQTLAEQAEQMIKAHRVCEYFYACLRMVLPAQISLPAGNAGFAATGLARHPGHLLYVRLIRQAPNQLFAQAHQTAWPPSSVSLRRPPAASISAMPARRC